MRKAERHGEATEPNNSNERRSFFRMFAVPRADFEAEALSDLAAAQNCISIRNTSDLPAGYTYLGQFIAHDLSEIKRSKNIPTSGSVPTGQILQERTPSLDLDCLYGEGLQDPDAVYKPNGEFYSENTLAATSSKSKRNLKIIDLPRGQGSYGTFAHIPDLRNDENLIVSRLHALFMNAHNRLLRKHIKENGPGPKTFENARKELTLIYQLIAKYDFLPRIIPDEMHGLLEETPWVKTLKEEKYVVSPLIDSIRGYGPRIPIEFAVAAFRYGHSLVRSLYILVEPPFTEKDKVDLKTLFELVGRGGLKGGSTNAHVNLDWSKFFVLDGKNDVAFRAHGINTRLQPDMQRLLNEKHGNKDLTLRNLLRGNELGLPDAQSCLDQLYTLRPECNDLDQLIRQRNLPSRTLFDEGELGTLSEKQKNLLDRVKAWGFDKKTPLWTYILMEPGFPTKYNQARLGLLGGTIVAEVFRSLFVNSRTAIYNPDSYPENFYELDPHKKISKQCYSMKQLYKLAGGR